ncbi:hypothetical protein BCU68_10815 [Vibrio sp. 10N.286.49.B3]|uniref:NAD(P)H-binding protein n=1 Tax=Vibrio sp. 10N.286.49.B3 TaxID=1880855 RepID=UPI000C81BDE4|nr:NAD(P)H-binding protein [Vibrio sp. 10N.286.49.B3]PMH45347.1 hypothetical protein BCU68_10815 [Vibrio sp. 10N.286.49.B3]
MNTSSHSAIIAGSTGLIGKALTQVLISNKGISHIYALSRRPLGVSSSKLSVLEHPNLDIPPFKPDDTLPKLGFICLGTTRKQAGSKAALEKIDLDLVVKVAKQMAESGVRKLAVVSSLGANPKSFSHYMRCKGKMEEELEAIGFEHITFMHPGPLVGERENTRVDEILIQRVIGAIQPVMRGKLRNYIPISDREVAVAMNQVMSKEAISCVERLNSVQIRQIAKTSG